MSHPATETSYFSMLWEVNFYVKLLCVHVSTFWGKKLGWGAGGGVGKFISNKSALTAAYRLAGFRLDREMRRLILQET